MECSSVNGLFRARRRRFLPAAGAKIFGLFDPFITFFSYFSAVSIAQSIHQRAFLGDSVSSMSRLHQAGSSSPPTFLLVDSLNVRFFSTSQCPICRITHSADTQYSDCNMTLMYVVGRGAFRKVVHDRDHGSRRRRAVSYVSRRRA